jgi:gliding motility-associated-like protein
VSKYDIPYLPNCFTPNNDGKNDYFEIEGNSLCDYDYYSVYSRWGQLLFKSKSLYEKWDGRKDGIDLPEGVYVIIFEGKKSFISFVTILR